MAISELCYPGNEKDGKSVSHRMFHSESDHEFDDGLRKLSRQTLLSELKTPSIFECRR